MRPERLTGRCYCGAHKVVADAAPLTVVHCHCSDCRRITGAAFGTFAAFAAGVVRVTPDIAPVSHNAGVSRQFCGECGSALTATYDYLPSQIYVPIGVMDDAASLVPERHSHADAMLDWVRLEDDLPRDDASGRASLNAIRS